MKALLPVYCRLMGYLILLVALFLPFALAMLGRVNDGNLLFYKECSKLLMMFGALMILLALTKGENAETEKIRVKATRNSVFLTIFFVFGNMIYHIAQRDVNYVDSTSFLVFLIFNVLCLEYGIKKASIDKMFRK